MVRPQALLVKLQLQKQQLQELQLLLTPTARSLVLLVVPCAPLVAELARNQV